MSTSDPRPGFRLPWQSAPDAEGTGEQPVATAVEPPAWPHHDLIRRIGANPDPVPVTDGDDPARDAHGRPQGAAQSGSPDAGAPELSHATEEKGESTTIPAPDAAATVHRRPTKFLADLTRAMRQAADESREATLAQCQADVTRHIEAARAQAETAGGDARRRADEDVATLREWSKAEIARIRQETEDNMTARRVGLETELAEQQARLELELERVADQVRAFEREMETFFAQLLHEEDPSAFAATAAQLPEPPAFEPWRPDMDPTASDAPARRPGGEAAGNGTASGGSKKARAAAAEAATRDAATAAANAAPAEELSADEVEARIGASVAMPPMRADDFAAAEAEAAHWAADARAPDDSASAAAEAASGDASSTPETPAAAATEPATPETPAAAATEPAAQEGAVWPKTRAAAAQPATGIRTQISVTGLVSVASIATFKRLLSRVQGVSSVQVSSGPDGEFLFAVAHEEQVDLAAQVVKLQGFDAQVVKSDGGVITVTASDPEAA